MQGMWCPKYTPHFMLTHTHTHTPLYTHTGSCTQWGIYDEYIKDLERQKMEESMKGKGARGKKEAKEEKAQQKTAKPGDAMHDPALGQVSSCFVCDFLSLLPPFLDCCCVLHGVCGVDESSSQIINSMCITSRTGEPHHGPHGQSEHV